MGATSIEVIAHGNSMKEAFKNAQKQAEEEYGNDIYNGAINNCDLLGDKTAFLLSKSDEGLWHYVNNKVCKREVIGICLKEPVKNTNSIKSVVARNPQKGSRKWVTKYKAKHKWSGIELGISEDTLTEAIKKARAHIESDKLTEKDPIQIFVTKELEKGNRNCAEVNYKRSKNQSAGVYKFMGFAPC